jgi:ubiquitin C-terminal hydrolase
MVMLFSTLVVNAVDSVKLPNQPMGLKSLENTCYMNAVLTNSA